MQGMRGRTGRSFAVCRWRQRAATRLGKEQAACGRNSTTPNRNCWRCTRQPERVGSAADAQSARKYSTVVTTRTFFTCGLPWSRSLMSITPWLALRMPPIRAPESLANCSADLRALAVASAIRAGLIALSFVYSKSGPPAPPSALEHDAVRDQFAAAAQHRQRAGDVGGAQDHGGRIAEAFRRLVVARRPTPSGLPVAAARPRFPSGLNPAWVKNARIVSRVGVELALHVGQVVAADRMRQRPDHEVGVDHLFRRALDRHVAVGGLAAGPCPARRTSRRRPAQARSAARRGWNGVVVGHGARLVRNGELSARIARHARAR